MRIPRIESLVPYPEAVGDLPDRDFVEVDGQLVFVKDRGAGPVIVLLHGFASTSESFRNLFDALSDDYRLVGIDLNGFGNTQRPPARKAYRIENQADLIAEVLRIKNIDEAVFVGHSYGCGVAVVIQKRHPDLVSRAILISPPMQVGEKPPWYLRNWLAAQIVYWLVRGLLSDPDRYYEVSARAVYVEGVYTRKLSEMYRRSMLVEGLRDAYFGYTSALAGCGEDVVPYRDLGVATLVVAGEKDAIVSVEDAGTVTGKISGARLETIPECGHCSPEERPEEVVRLIREFLAKDS